jgi:hypothetical protein
VPSIPGLDLGKPGSDRGSGPFGNFELTRPARLFLNDGCAVSNTAASADIVDLWSDEITASELAIDGEIEQREVTRSLLELEPHPNCPDIFRLQRTLLPGETPLVPWNVRHNRLL